jgi:hypothetical protein
VQRTVYLARPKVAEANKTTREDKYITANKAIDPGARLNVWHTNSHAGEAVVTAKEHPKGPPVTASHYL